MEHFNNQIHSSKLICDSFHLERNMIVVRFDYEPNGSPFGSQSNIQIYEPNGSPFG